jgi:hypothetical protein
LWKAKEDDGLALQLGKGGNDVEVLSSLPQGRCSFGSGRVPAGDGDNEVSPGGYPSGAFVNDLGRRFDQKNRTFLEENIFGGK